jgi:hypothetical protein
VIEVKSAGYPALELNLSLASGEHATVSHTFGKTDPAKLPLSKYWRDLKRKFGGS